jgi:hydrogenase maturation protein HypF
MPSSIDSPKPPAARPVLALGAWLKNTACLLDADGAHASTLHGDLRDAQACQALETSARDLITRAREPIAAIAHDLHPDFFSTHLALTLAEELKIPAIAVQHHHAHIGAVMAEHGLSEPVIGLALDGVGLGSDGAAWGGELLWVAPGNWKRLGHLWPLALPGGDAAARQPWRMLASGLHAMGRSAEIEPRLAPAVGAGPARMIARMLDARLNCPSGTSAGRWFDAAAAALSLHLLAQTEAEAAIALEQQAARWLNAGESVDFAAPSAQQGRQPVLDIRPLLATLLAWPDGPDKAPAAAAWFHLMLAEALADWAAHAARQADCRTVCLGGGCFMNAILTREVTARLESLGLRVLRPQVTSCGDAGLALGQAWVVAQQLNQPDLCHQLIKPTEVVS